MPYCQTSAGASQLGSESVRVTRRVESLEHNLTNVLVKDDIPIFYIISIQSPACRAAQKGTYPEVGAETATNQYIQPAPEN